VFVILLTLRSYTQSRNTIDTVQASFMTETCTHTVINSFTTVYYLNLCILFTFRESFCFHQAYFKKDTSAKWYAKLTFT